MKILIVDDQPLNLKLLRAHLEAEGHRVIDAADGVEALAALAREPVDAIVSDILMPRMDGYRLCHEVRKRAHWRDLPFVFHTATYTSPADERLCYDLGADAYLRKPASAADILAALAKACVRETGMRPVPGSLSETDVLREYNERLVHKLEDKNQELARALGRLQEMSALVELAPGAVLVRDLAGRITHWNAGAERLYGWTAAEAVGRDVTDLIANDPADIAASRAALAAHGEIYVEHEHRTKDGRVLSVEVRARVLRDGSGAPCCAIATLVDATERRRMEAALRESEDRYRDLVEHSRDMIFTHDLDGRLRSVNEATVAQSGHAREALLTMNVRDLLAPMAREGFSAYIEALRGDGQTRGMTKVTAADGSSRYWEYDATLRTAGVSQPVVRGRASDVTERVRTKAALRASEARTQLLVQASRIGLWDWDLKTNVVYYSPEWKQQLGYAADELPDRYEEWESRLHADDRQLTLAAIDEFIHGRRKDFKVQFRLRHRSGGWRWIYSCADFERDAAGVPVRMMGCDVDVTEHREAFIRLQTLSRRLLTVQETERRLLARELHDEFGQMLTAIKLNLQALHDEPERGGAGPRVAGSVQMVAQALEQVRSMSLSLRPPLLDELGLVPALRWLANQDLRHPGLQIELCCDANDARYGSLVETACFRIAQEAISNAMRHASAHSIVLDLEARDDALHLRVKDDGVGFDVAKARSRSEGGASLGMLGMEERAGLAGGHIEWRRLATKGTEVHAWFPRGNRVPSAAPEAAAPAAPQSQPRSANDTA